MEVEDGDAREAHAIDGGLTSGGITVDIAHVGLLHQSVVDARVLQGQLGRASAHGVVGLTGTGLGERDHAHAHDVDGALRTG